MGGRAVILLDTHAWIWLINDPKSLSLKVQREISVAIKKKALFISCISSWEIHMLVRHKRLSFSISSENWVRRCEKLSYLNFVPVDNNLAFAATHLPGEFHGDPADRIIVATARQHDFVLVSKDEKIQKYPHVETLW
jgi:PIN domain nuclease of toxin-antitoxin system